MMTLIPEEFKGNEPPDSNGNGCMTILLETIGF